MDIYIYIYLILIIMLQRDNQLLDVAKIRLYYFSPLQHQTPMLRSSYANVPQLSLFELLFRNIYRKLFLAPLRSFFATSDIRLAQHSLASTYRTIAVRESLRASNTRLGDDEYGRAYLASLLAICYPVYSYANRHPTSAYVLCRVCIPISCDCTKIRSLN